MLLCGVWIQLTILPGIGPREARAKQELAFEMRCICTPNQAGVHYTELPDMGYVCTVMVIFPSDITSLLNFISRKQTNPSQLLNLYILKILRGQKYLNAWCLVQIYLDAWCLVHILNKCLIEFNFPNNLAIPFTEHLETISLMVENHKSPQKSHVQSSYFSIIQPGP